MTLKKLILTNFQSHQDTTISFSPKITVVTGQSDAGKTALIRALLWVLTNRPAGTGFITQGHQTSSVTLTTMRGDSIKRTKSTGKGKENAYQVNDQSYNVVGQGVPLDLKPLIHFDETNVQTQLEAHLLALESPPKIAELIYQAAGLQVGLDLLSQLQKLRRQTNILAENQDVEITETEQQLEQVDPDLEANQAKLQQAIDLIADIAETQNDLAKLKHQQSVHKLVATNVAELETLTAAVQVLLTQGAELCRIITTTDNMLTTYQQLKQRHHTHKAIVTSHKIGIKDITKWLKTGTITVTSLTTTQRRLTKLTKVMTEVTNLRQDITAGEQAIKIIKARCDTMRKQLTICPTCKRPIAIGDLQ